MTIAGKVEVHDVPAYDDGSSRKCAHGDQADAQVLNGEEVVDAEKDGETSDDERRAEEDEGEPETRIVGCIRCDETKGQCCGDRGHGVQLGLHCGVTKRFDYGWREVGEGCDIGKQSFFDKRGRGTEIDLPESTYSIWG